jgi:transposase
MTVTTQREECTATVGGRLLMSMELSRRQWKLGFTTGVGQRSRRRTLSTDVWDRLPEEIAAAKMRFRLPADAPVISCYEAGRDGFWIHRYLTSLGVKNLVVDSSSIEVNRRARRAKTDRMDVEKLLAMLLRYVGGEQTVWRIVHVPSEADEHRRQLHRELWTLKRDRVRLMNRIAGLLAIVGVLLNVDAKFRARLDRLMQWNGQPLPEALRVRLARE